MKNVKQTPGPCPDPPQLTLSPSMAHVNAACRKDFVSFVRKVFHVLNPSATFDMNWHICAIAYYLELVRLGKIKRLIITAAAAFTQVDHVLGRVPGFCSGARSDQARDCGQLQRRSGDQSMAMTSARL